LLGSPPFPCAIHARTLPRPGARVFREWLAARPFLARSGTDSPPSRAPNIQKWWVWALRTHHFWMVDGQGGHPGASVGGPGASVGGPGASVGGPRPWPDPGPGRLGGASFCYSRGMAVIGAHVQAGEAIAQAQARGANATQIFLGDPKGWKGPVVDFDGGAPALKEAAAQAGVTLFVHAPYVLNVASLNNRIRIPSRKLLQKHVDLATEIGAAGVVVHGGHVRAGDAYAGVVELEGMVGRVLAATGRIDLVHVNESRDAFDSGADRHATLGEGSLPQDQLAALVRQAGAPMILETPGDDAAHAREIAWLREQCG